ncbi:MAG: metallophosphoesterase [Acidobacteria bacterium]|nr:metallophosphoesterase [Acidobacteriota bacterium]MBI3424207.1 metallophosphoesterase [Acidobacteriota bacterium]
MAAFKLSYKRSFLTLALLAVGLAAGLAAGLAVWAFVIEPNRLVVRETQLALPNWPRPLNGLRIAALADLHIGAPHMNLAKLRRIVALTNAQQPDLILLLGDYVIQGVAGGQFVEPALIAKELAQLQAEAGVFAVLGNHDQWYSAARVKSSLEQVGILVLENEVAAISLKGGKLWLAGLSDEWTGQPDVPGTFAKVTDAAPILALTHNPDLFPRIPPNVILTLAGHTHGGQCAFPWLGRPIVPSAYGQRYAAGLVLENNRRLFVTTGLGTSILPVRFGVPPEIALLQLSSP